MHRTRSPYRKAPLVMRRRWADGMWYRR